MRLHDDDNKEAESIITWTERRLEQADSGMLRAYVKQFKSMWLESFGTLDSIPTEFKEKVELLHKNLKEKESVIGG